MENELHGGEKASRNCPNCHSTKIWKDGTRKNVNNYIQRYICPACEHRFSETTVLSTRLNHDINRQVCASIMEAKNLTSVEPQNQRSAGAIRQKETETKETIFEYKWWLKKQGYAESTITSRAKLLKVMMKRGADLDNPETIKEVIAEQKWCSGRKENAVHAYSSFLKMAGGKWEPPRYRKISRHPFIPTETEIDQLIAGCGKRIAILLQLLKETGVRIGEAWNLEWIHIDTMKRVIRVTPEKGSNPRTLPISIKLMKMFNSLTRKNTTSKIFGSRRLKSQRRLYTKNRRKIAEKLKNPRMLQITFHTFRHWKATSEYHKNPDILHVKKIMGHKSIHSTMIYTQLIDVHDDEYIVKVSSSLKEDAKYIEAGFEYVTDRDGIKIYRKRK